MNHEQIARVAHEINRAYCESIGDTSHLRWEDAPEWQKKSAIDGVHFHLNNLGASPAASHENWLADKRRDGWKFGLVKDLAKKEHPCFTPYNNLPQEQRSKDFLFRAVVHALKT